MRSDKLGRELQRGDFRGAVLFVEGGGGLIAGGSGTAMLFGINSALLLANVASPILSAMFLDNAIDEAIGRVLRQVARGQEIQVVVAPALVAEMEQLVAVRQNGDRRRLAIAVVADPALQPGDAHINWEQGGVILDAAARAAVVRDALDALLSAPAATGADDQNM